MTLARCVSCPVGQELIFILQKMVHNPMLPPRKRGPRFGAQPPGGRKPETAPAECASDRRFARAFQDRNTKVRNPRLALVRMCKEINSSYAHGNVLAVALLMRTVLNHIPPVFGHDTFAQVLTGTGKSLKDSFNHLENGLRKVADFSPSSAV